MSSARGVAGKFELWRRTKTFRPDSEEQDDGVGKDGKEATKEHDEEENLQHGRPDRDFLIVNVFVKVTLGTFFTNFRDIFVWTSKYNLDHPCSINIATVFTDFADVSVVITDLRPRVLKDFIGGTHHWPLVRAEPEAIIQLWGCCPSHRCLNVPSVIGI